MAAFVAYSLDAASRRLCLRSPTPLIAGAPIVWAHVAHEGEWKGHPGGPFKLTRAHFEQALANLSARATPPKVDFDHETDFCPAGTPLPARGWVQDLHIRTGPDGRAQLWAQLELGAKAVEAQRDGGYRFCSAVFDFEAVDRVTGETIGFALQRLALTDDPFIDGQSPIRITLSAVEPTSAVAQRSGVMIAWFPPAELAADIAVPGGEPADRLHVTLAYFGRSLEPGALERIAAALGEVAASHSELVGAIAGAGRFPASETTDGLDVVWAPVDVPGLSQLRAELVTALAEAGAPAPRADHDFTPHMTLASVPSDADSPIRSLTPRSIRVAVIELVHGDDRRPFELGKPPPTTEEANQMADENDDDQTGAGTSDDGGGAGDDTERQLSAADDAVAALAAKLGMTTEELLAAMESKSDAIAAALGSSDPAPTDVTLSALRVQLSAATARSTKAEREAATVRAQLQAYREKEADAAVEELVQGGRILDSGRAFARKLFLSDRQGFDAFTAGLPKAVPVGPHASGSAPPTEETPAIDENDPEVKELRVWLSNGGVTGEAADKAIRKRLSERRSGRAV